MVGVSASVNLPLHHKVQKFSSGTGSPGWCQKKGRETVVLVVLTDSYAVDCWWQRQVLRHIRAIAAEAKQELMNAFRREMTLQLVAVSRDKSSSDFNKRLLRQKKAAQKQQPRNPDVSNMNVEY